jgi:hypothetical protein
MAPSSHFFFVSARIAHSLRRRPEGPEIRARNLRAGELGDFPGGADRADLRPDLQ